LTRSPHLHTGKFQNENEHCCKVEDTPGWLLSQSSISDIDWRFPIAVAAALTAHSGMSERHINLDFTTPESCA
jgi:hypothetical protein